MPSKGVNYLIDAAPFFSNLIFCFVGFPEMSDSSLIDRLFELCQQYDHISFIPGTKKPNVEIAKANVVCLPSLYGEGTPKSLIEALAAGKFILCTNIPGARDCVIDGVNGFLLDTNNIKNDLFLHCRIWMFLLNLAIVKFIKLVKICQRDTM